MPRLAAASRFRCWQWPVMVALVLAAYPTFVLANVYWKFFQADLPGGRNGPADAYRHSLASAIVAYTLSPRCVDWVTRVMESDGLNDASGAMDAHNNRIGARLGAAAPSWAAMQRDVRAAVEHGAVNAASTDQITWLAPTAWQERLY